MISTEIHKIEDRKINKTKSWIFEKINKTDKPLARLNTKKEDSKSVMKEKTLRLMAKI